MYQTRTRDNCALPKSTLGFLIIALSIGLFGCAPPASNSNVGAPASNTNVTASANSNANSNANQSSTSEASAENVPITMPVVDALLSDEEFLGEVKKSVQPSDEQLDKLKTAARDEVLKLNESGGDDDDVCELGHDCCSLVHSATAAW